MPHCSEDDILTVTTTVGSMKDARQLARELVESDLAACVQVEPIAASFYRWEGRLREEAEVRLTLKTLPAREEALQDFFKTHHPYDLPQFVAVRGSASEAYARWVRGDGA